MKILIWTKHPGDLLGEAITFLTHGPAQHAGFLRQNGMIHEAYLPNVRDRKPIAAELPFVKTFSLRGLPAEFDAAFEDHFDRALNGAVKYSIDDLFRYLFNEQPPNEDHTYCSRYVLHTVIEIAPVQYWPLVRVAGIDTVPPYSLFTSPILIPDSPLTLLEPESE